MSKAINITSKKHYVKSPIRLRADELQFAYSTIINFYKKPTYKLIKHLQAEHNYSLEKIGKVIGISKQAIQQQYLKKLEVSQ